MSVASPRTAQELCNYSETHGLNGGISKSWNLKHFGLIADSLAKDEYVLTAFVGFHNYKSMSKHDGCFAYAITNKRFIMAQKKMIGSTFQTVSLKNINDITMDKGILAHKITIDTIKETFNVETSDPKTAQNIHTAIQNALAHTKRNQSSNPGVLTASAQLIELKKLLDAGIITQRDFDLKKKQLLGI